MACFLVPGAEAVVVTVMQKRAQKAQESAEAEGKDLIEVSSGIPFAKKLSWLSYMLWGGVILLAFEHVWHGEVVPWFPFLSAMSNPSDAAEMFLEMGTVGVCMALLITVVWFGMCIAADAIAKRPEAEAVHNENV